MPEYSRRLYQEALLYEQPNTDSKVLNRLLPGLTVRVLDLQRTWLMVENPAQPGQTGFIAYRAIQPPRGGAQTNRPDDLQTEAASVPSGPPATDVRNSLTEENVTTDAAKPVAPASNTPEGAPLPSTKRLTNAVSAVEKSVAMAWNRYGGLLEAMGTKYRIDAAILAAVVAVESGSTAFGPGNRMIIRFENHLFFDYWGKKNKDVYDKHFKFSSTKRWQDHMYRPTETSEWQTFHGDQLKEWVVLDFASGFNTAAARMAISMGLPQVLGANFKRLGYATVNEMFKALNDKDTGERAQLLAMLKFIETDPYNRGLISLRNQDFTAFATMYNGPGKAEFYGNLISERWQALKRMLAQ
ncbi:MAG: DUF3380 domain-containing protein [Anaerolineae bacterium]|nr:MAG: DUF3380 domain-containing protein [Anaerolineae bacterium]